MTRLSTGGTHRQTTVRMSGRMHDRLITISARLGLPLSEIIIRLIIIGLDTSQDLALDQRAVEGVARYDNSPMDNPVHSTDGSGERTDGVAESGGG
jgi:predicted DNA-binding protein